jgi:hypothetical protein
MGRLVLPQEQLEPEIVLGVEDRKDSKTHDLLSRFGERGHVPRRHSSVAAQN